MDRVRVLERIVCVHGISRQHFTLNLPDLRPGNYSRYVGGLVWVEICQADHDGTILGSGRRGADLRYRPLVILVCARLDVDRQRDGILELSVHVEDMIGRGQDHPRSIG